MKRFLVLLTVMLLFAGCAVPSPIDDAALNPDTGIRMYTQFEVIDDSAKTLQMMIENNSGASVSFGTEWTLEKRSGSGWKQLPFKPDVGFESILIGIADGGDAARMCHLSLIQSRLTDGEYRIVKEIGGHPYAAFFTVGDSSVTADAPYGFAPLASMPDTYSIDDAAADGCLVIRHGEQSGEDALTKFIAWPRGQLRIASLTFEGDVILADVIADGERYEYIRDNTRDAWADSTIVRSFYANLLTDGESLWLSNRAKLDESAVYLCAAPKEICEAAAALPRAILASWSPDGSASVELAEDDRLLIRSSTCGMVHTLAEDVTITDFLWQDDKTLLAVAELGERYYYEFIRVDGNDISRLSHTISAHRPEWHDGELVIPE